MERQTVLRPIFAFLEDAERLGVYVRCPRASRPRDIGECLGCPEYHGLHLGDFDDQPHRLKCSAADRAEERGRELPPSAGAA